MSELINVGIVWVIIAFFIGGALTLGMKVVDHLWPDRERIIVIEYRAEDGNVKPA